jgi:SAM-dependent methyltransferase
VGHGVPSLLRRRAEIARLARTFDRSAAAYERGRPGYPPQAIRFLARAFGLGPGSTVVELGSGTGKFTRTLQATGAAIVAVEPLAGMRAQFERRLPDVLVLPGRAEAIPVPDGFADAVFAAQAFHWFHGPRTLREIARVLRPGGGLGLVWNNRDTHRPWTRALNRIFDECGAPRKYLDGDLWAPFRRTTSPFPPPRQRRFRHVQRVTPSELRDRVLSVSVIQAQPPKLRRAAVARLREVLANDPATRGRRVIDLPYETEVHYTRLRRRRA